MQQVYRHCRQSVAPTRLQNDSKNSIETVWSKGASRMFGACGLFGHAAAVVERVDWLKEIS